MRGRGGDEAGECMEVGALGATGRRALQAPWRPAFGLSQWESLQGSVQRSDAISLAFRLTCCCVETGSMGRSRGGRDQSGGHCSDLDNRREGSIRAPPAEVLRGSRIPYIYIYIFFFFLQL